MRVRVKKRSVLGWNKSYAHMYVNIYSTHMSTHIYIDKNNIYQLNTGKENLSTRSFLFNIIKIVFMT